MDRQTDICHMVHLLYCLVDGALTNPQEHGKEHTNTQLDGWTDIHLSMTKDGLMCPSSITQFDSDLFRWLVFEASDFYTYVSCWICNVLNTTWTCCIVRMCRENEVDMLMKK